jgi:hypothetical protein
MIVTMSQPSRDEIRTQEAQMSRRSLVLIAVVAALVCATPALADTAKSVTATGTGVVNVTPKNRNSESSIAAAVDAARKAGIKGAIAEAHEYALNYAKAVGLSLGPVISVSDAQNSNFYGPGGPFGFYGPFGPNQYCGTLRQVVGKPVKHRKPHFKKVHRCFVPQSEATSLTVTYSAT